MEDDSLVNAVDAIFEATADLIIRVGVGSAKLIPNPPVYIGPLNERVAKYQEHLNEMELKIVRSIELAKQPPLPAPEPVPEPAPEVAEFSELPELPDMPELSENKQPSPEDYNALFDDDYLNF